MDPLSFLGRLAAAVPPPRFHTVKYAGVLASASKRRARIVPKGKSTAETTTSEGQKKPTGCRYWPWAELLKRTFGYEVLECPKCKGRMKLSALVTDPASLARSLEGIGEPTEPPARSPPRGPPYWKSTVLRRAEAGDGA